MNKRQTIACFHLNQVGDLLFSLPALYNLRENLPEAHIISIARPQCCELLRMSGLVDEIVERPRSYYQGLAVARRLRRRPLDLALLFSMSFGMWSMAQLSGARVRVGFKGGNCPYFLSKTVPCTCPPSTANDLRMIESLGCQISKRDYVNLIHVSDDDCASAREILRSEGMGDERFIVLSPGTSGRREIKCWLDQGYADLADRVYAEYGMRSAIIGVGTASPVASLSPNIVDLTGKTSIRSAAAVLSMADVFVGVDSGMMHLAAAVGRPVVGLFGPSNPAATGPQGTGHAVITSGAECSPCLKSACPDPVCMTHITISQVLAAVSQALTATRQ